MKMPVLHEKNKLLALYDEVAEGCIECGLCQKDCKFLQRYGLPKQIADKHSLKPDNLRVSFECSLCWLCTAVCPKDIDPAAMFGGMRDLAHASGCGRFKEHASLLRYEQWGLSPSTTWHALPEGCTTVFFPGCAMAGTRAARVHELYTHLRKAEPSLGIVLDCCTKPSHDLGRKDYFSKMFGALRDALAFRGVQEILVACPSCYRVWQDYGSPIRVKSVYEKLAEKGPLHTAASGRDVTVHDPCPTRYNPDVHAAVRKLVRTMGLSLREMKHQGKKTLCCGEGGAACYVAPDMAGNWTSIRDEEAEGDFMITYCAGCTQFLGRKARVGHILDLFFAPELTLAGREPVERSPWTWLQRILLKRKLKKERKSGITGARSKQGTVQLSS